MSQNEFEAWQEFYVGHPFDDLHRFHRPAALVAQRMGGGEIKPLLDWLQPPANSSEFSDVDLSFFKAFGIKAEK